MVLAKEDLGRTCWARFKQVFGPFRQAWRLKAGRLKAGGQWFGKRLRETDSLDDLPAPLLIMHAAGVFLAGCDGGKTMLLGGEVRRWQRLGRWIAALWRKMAGSSKAADNK